MTQLQIRIDDAGRHQVYRTELGIDRLDVGEPWKTPREAIDYSDQLAARASRSAERLTSRSGLGPVEGEPSAQSSEAPGPQDASTSTCAGCGGPLPPGRHGQRRLTCSVACRRRAARQAAAEGRRADADGAAPLSHLPRPSEAVAVPASPAVPGGCALPGPAEDVGHASSRSRGIPVQTLGL